MSKSSASSSRFSGDVMTEAHSRVGSRSRFVVRVGRISHGLWQPSKSAPAVAKKSTALDFWRWFDSEVRRQNQGEGSDFRSSGYEA
ncbi:hypothetical protein OROHE_022629 [Orobanche hederae]